MALSEVQDNKKLEDEEMKSPIEGREKSGDEIEESEKEEQTEEYREEGDPFEGGETTLVETEESEEVYGESDDEERGMITDESGKKSSMEVDEKSGEESTSKKKARKKYAANSSSERPVREKKIVDRYSSLESPISKEFSIEKGNGIPLKDIPNVAFMLSKRKSSDENLKTLHSILFARKSSAHTLKKNLGQFSGFVWVENEKEKLRAKVKDKLEKCVKEKLLDFCTVLNIPINKTAVRKEVSAKVFEFLESPHATTNKVLADKEQKSKMSKKKKSLGKKIKPMGIIGESPSKKQKKSYQKKKRSLKTKEEHDDKVKEPLNAKDSSDEDDSQENTDESKKILKSPHAATNTVPVDKEQKGKKRGRRPSETSGESPSKKQKRRPVKRKKGLEEHGDKAEPSEAKYSSRNEEINDPDSKTDGKKESESVENKEQLVEDKPGSRNLSENIEVDLKEENTAAVSPKRLARTPVKTAGKDSPIKERSKSKKQAVEKESQVDCSLSSMKKAVGKKETSAVQGKGKTLKKAKVEPTKEEIHAAVVYILKEVDFNTVTLSDIIKKLGAHFDMDLMHKKIEVKAIITDVVNSMPDEEDEEEAEGIELKDDEEGEKNETDEKNEDDNA